MIAVYDPLFIDKIGLIFMLKFRITLFPLFDRAPDKKKPFQQQQSSIQMRSPQQIGTILVAFLFMSMLNFGVLSYFEIDKGIEN